MLSSAGLTPLLPPPPGASIWGAIRLAAHHLRTQRGFQLTFNTRSNSRK